jgi:hypothetical protein
VLAAALTSHVAIGGFALTRPGYSPDEEITATAIRAISEHGAPFLPSGVFYSRGVPYLYAAWGAGQLFGETLPVYRGVSLAASVAGIAAVFWAAGRLVGPAIAGLTALLLAVFPPYLASAVFARQYSALVACSLASIAILARWVQEPRRERAWMFAATVAVAGTLHPLGLILLALPAAYASARADGSPGPPLAEFGRLSGLSLLVTIVAQLPHAVHWWSVMATGTAVTAETAIYAVPALVTPPAFYVTSAVDLSGWAATTILFAAGGLAVARRVSASEPWSIVTITVLAATCQVGVLIVFVAVDGLLRPFRWYVRAAISAALGTLSFVWWAVVLAWQTDALFSVSSMTAMWRLASWYPLAALRYTAESVPALAIAATVGALMACRSTPTTGSTLIRALAALLVLTLVAFSAVGIPLAERYMLLPWTVLVLLATYAIVGAGGLIAERGHRTDRVRRSLRWAVVALLFGSLTVGHVAYGRARAEFSGRLPGSLGFVAPRTGTSWSPDVVRHYVQPNDRVICAEELACLHLLDRVDYLLALTPVDLAHYAVRRHGRVRGFYADTPVIATREQLSAALLTTRERCSVVVIVNSGKVDFETPRQAVLDVLALGARVLADTDELFVSRHCGGAVDSTRSP